MKALNPILFLITIVSLLLCIFTSCMTVKFKAGPVFDGTGITGFEGGMCWGIGGRLSNTQAVFGKESFHGGGQSGKGGYFHIGYGAEYMQLPEKKGIGYSLGANLFIQPMLSKNDVLYLGYSFEGSILPVLSHSKDSYHRSEKGYDIFPPLSSWLNLGVAFSMRHYFADRKGGYNSFDSYFTGITFEVNLIRKR